MDGTSPDSWARRVNAHDVNCTPWSEWITVPEPGSPLGRGLRLAMAILSALVASAAVWLASTDQPTASSAFS